MRRQRTKAGLHANQDIYPRHGQVLRRRFADVPTVSKDGEGCHERDGAEHQVCHRRRPRRAEESETRRRHPGRPDAGKGSP